MTYQVKHDAHVKKFKFQFFPFKFFLFSLFMFFSIGLFLGHTWGFYSCIDFKSLFGS
jgi:hypothetical protein